MVNTFPDLAKFDNKRALCRIYFLFGLLCLVASGLAWWTGPFTVTMYFFGICASIALTGGVGLGLWTLFQLKTSPVFEKHFKQCDKLESELKDTQKTTIELRDLLSAALCAIQAQIGAGTVAGLLLAHRQSVGELPAGILATQPVEVIAEMVAKLETEISESDKTFDSTVMSISHDVNWRLVYGQMDRLRRHQRWKDQQLQLLNQLKSMILRVEEPVTP